MSEKNSFEKKYPNIARFTDEYGWIEIGGSGNPYVNAFIRAYDEGGTVWEGRESYATIDQALEELEREVSKWFKEVVGE